MFNQLSVFNEQKKKYTPDQISKMLISTDVPMQNSMQLIEQIMKEKIKKVMMQSLLLK